MLAEIASYFLLSPHTTEENTEPMLGNAAGQRAKRIGGRARLAWTLGLYGAVYLGILGQGFLDPSRRLGVRTMIASAVIATVIFPYIHRNLRRNGPKLSGVDLFLAFQGGFFWNRALEIIGKASSGQ